jgi:hypothetical protein
MSHLHYVCLFVHSSRDSSGKCMLSRVTYIYSLDRLVLAVIRETRTYFPSVSLDCSFGFHYCLFIENIIF